MEKKTWTLPVETVFNGDTMEDDYVLTFPEDLLEQAGWKAGDVLNWIDNGNGSFTLKKVGDSIDENSEESIKNFSLGDK